MRRHARESVSILTRLPRLPHHSRLSREGLSTIEELAAKRKAQKDASVSASLGLQPPPKATATEQRDADLAAKIRAAAEKEAARKLASGDLSSNPHGEKSPIKPLGSILDLSKIEDNEEMNADKIRELWTGYHSLKGKLSAAIPTEVYERLIKVARQYPQFVLPLPRTIVGGDDPEGEVQATNLQPGEKKQGYEMQFLEWGFIPTATPGAPPATTVLFTPLAEYKLRQEFAQPLLILTHYTDLARSKGVVLMRGDVTSAEEVEANPAGVAAAEAAKGRGASVEEQERLKQTPVQTTVKAPPEEGGGGGGAKMSEKDAQLLAMTMQRFYLPNAAEGDAAAKERKELLRAFHEDKDAFSVPRLCEVAFTF